MDKEIVYECEQCNHQMKLLEIGKEFVRVCPKCEGYMKPIRIADSKKSRNSITVGIELEGYEKMKQQLRNLESTFDRILEKQERIGALVGNPNDHELLLRIDTDLGRIVRRLGCDKIQSNDSLVPCIYAMNYFVGFDMGSEPKERIAEHSRRNAMR